jgi:hypothetical protein
MWRHHLAIVDKGHRSTASQINTESGSNKVLPMQLPSSR